MIHEKFLTIQQKIFPGEQMRELQRESETRCWCRGTSCENALLCLECIVRLLNDTGARALSARGLLAQMDADLFIYYTFLQNFSEK